MRVFLYLSLFCLWLSFLVEVSSWFVRSLLSFSFLGSLLRLNLSSFGFLSLSFFSFIVLSFVCSVVELLLFYLIDFRVGVSLSFFNQFLGLFLIDLLLSLVSGHSFQELLVKAEVGKHGWLVVDGHDCLESLVQRLKGFLKRNGSDFVGNVQAADGLLKELHKFDELDNCLSHCNNLNLLVLFLVGFLDDLEGQSGDACLLADFEVVLALVHVL